MENIFENMSQLIHDQLCLDEDYKNALDSESEKVGRARIDEALSNNEWMTPEEFGNHLKNEIKRIYKK